MVTGPGDSPLGLCTREGNGHEMALLLRPGHTEPSSQPVGSLELAILSGRDVSGSHFNPKC